MPNVINNLVIIKVAMRKHYGIAGRINIFTALENQLREMLS